MSNFASSQLGPRVLSAIVLASIFLALYYFFGRNGLLIFGIIFAGLGLSEFSRMMFSHLSRPLQLRVRSCFLLAGFGILFLVLSPRLTYSFLPMAIAFTCVALSFWFVHLHLQISEIYTVLSRVLFGLIYIPVMSLAVLSLLHSSEGELWFWFLVATVVTTDISAYFSGILFGDKKISPIVSPKKSWAGVIGALGGSALVGVVFAQLYPLIFDLGPAVSIAVFGSFMAQTGDFFESLLKRHVGVKDSGRLMPGHGGVLDRLDGVLFAAPIFAVAFIL